MITASAGTAMDVFSKLPGVSIDPEGMIRYNNKSGVLVLIDNKPTYLSGTDLVNLLPNMSAYEIESVEIVPDPPCSIPLLLCWIRPQQNRVTLHYVLSM